MDPISPVRRGFSIKAKRLPLNANEAAFIPHASWKEENSPL
jgi:hypothetical protein